MRSRHFVYALLLGVASFAVAGCSGPAPASAEHVEKQKTDAAQARDEEILKAGGKPAPTKP